jgi:hypothetical protein
MNKNAVGKEGTFTMQLERGKILEFARAVHGKSYSSETPTIPPTFLTTTFFWEEGVNPWTALEMDQRRGMHAEQEYIFHGPPPRAGMKLHCRSRIAEIYEKQGKRGGTLTFAVMITEFRDDDGNLVAEAKLTGVEVERVS